MKEARANANRCLAAYNERDRDVVYQWSTNGCDGTLAEDGHGSAETWDALRAAKAAHLTLILVTGRTLANFTPDGPFAELIDVAD